MPIARGSGGWYNVNVGTALGLPAEYVAGTTVVDGGMTIPKAAAYYDVELELDWLLTPWPGYTTPVAGDFILGSLYLTIDNDGAGGSGYYYDPPGNTTTPTTSSTPVPIQQSVLYVQALAVGSDYSRGVHGLRVKGRLPANPNAVDTIYPCLSIRINSGSTNANILTIKADSYMTMTIRAY
jgi:hypothetical protein